MALPDTLRIATRGSRLARIQAETIADLVRDRHPGITVELVVVSTKGDGDQRPFAAIGGKGLFTAEVEHALLDGRADVAVHSAKDLTAELAEGCRIVCVPARGPAHDVVVTAELDPALASLPPGSTVGSSSSRRRTLLAEVRPDLAIAELRGNLDTRLQRIAEGAVDAAVLAAAGLARLGDLPDGIRTAPLDPSQWVPAPGQGILAVEAGPNGDEAAALFEGLTDEAAAAALRCEREFSAALEGGCSIPLGCYAESRDGRLVVTGYLAAPDGSASLRDRISGGNAQAAELGRELALAILGAGGDEIVEDIRASTQTTPEAP